MSTRFVYYIYDTNTKLAQYKASAAQFNKNHIPGIISCIILITMLDNIKNQPVELILEYISHLKYKDIQELCRTSTRINKICKTNKRK